MKSIRKILVPVDYSDNATRALGFATKIAEQAKASILVFHAYPINIPPTTGGLGQMPVLTLEEQTQMAMEAMDHFLRGRNFPDGIKVEKKVVPGPLTQSVEETCADENIDLIVMGTKGATGLKETFVGSNTARVIEEIKRPVLVVPEGAEYETIKKVAFAYDNTEDHENEDERIEFLKSFSDLYNAYLEVVTVENPKDQEDERTISDDLHRKLRGIERKIDVIVGKNVEKTLYDYIDNERVNLLVILSQKHSFVDRLFRESLTRKLAYHVTIPLLAL